MTEKELNPLLIPSSQLDGATPFHLIEKRHYPEALATAIPEAKAALQKIIAQEGPATFANTILALETAPEKVNHVARIFFNQVSVQSDEDMQAMARDLSPQLAAFSSDILLNQELFSRVKAVHEGREKAGLNSEQLRLTEKTYKEFVRNGAVLDEDKKNQLRQIDQELARLSPEYSDNVLKATNAFQMVITDEKDLKGLPETVIETAAQAAKNAGHENAWMFTLHSPSYLPFMTYAENRELREKLWRAFNSRCFGGEVDNSENCLRIVNLRHQRARLLGYKSHADFVLEERMAESPQKVISFLERLLGVSKKAAERDVEAVRRLKEELSGDPNLMPWDYAFYSEKLKQREFALDEEQLRPYFKLENVIEGVFEHARRLYGLKFKLRPEIPVFHPDVKAYEVTQEEDGSFVGLFYADFFPRPSKRGGAWMTSYLEQGLFGGEIRRPHVSIVCNFTQPTPTKPSLLSLDEVETLFHEFGHSLHALLSDCTYVSLAGTNVYWDFVELPSQIMENWVFEKEALDLFATHYETGERIPQELTDKIRKSATFQAGYVSLRQLNFGLLDMAWHSSDPGTIKNVSDFERQVTARTSVLPKIEGTNFSTSFSHIFAGGYSAGYYSYKWAEVLDADAFELFQEKGLFDKDVARSFRENILARGGTRHPMELYKNFRGREPDPDALLRRDGLL